MERDNPDAALDCNQIREKWYCRIGNAEYGPLSYSLLQQLVRDGKLSFRPKDLVRLGQDGRWMTIDSVASLQLLCKDNRSPDGHSVPANVVQANEGTRLRFGLLEPVSRMIHRIFAPIEGMYEYAIDLLPDQHAVAERMKVIILYIGRSLISCARTLTIVSCILIWIVANCVYIYYPQLGQVILWQLTQILRSPATWFLAIAFGAFAGAFHFKARA